MIDICPSLCRGVHRVKQHWVGRRGCTVTYVRYTCRARTIPRSCVLTYVGLCGIIRHSMYSQPTIFNDARHDTVRFARARRVCTHRTTTPKHRHRHAPHDNDFPTTPARFRPPTTRRRFSAGTTPCISCDRAHSTPRGDKRPPSWVCSEDIPWSSAGDHDHTPQNRHLEI